jgi:hypothetical protein
VYDEAAIDEILGRIERREGAADFRVNAVLRMLYLDKKMSALPTLLKQNMEKAVLGFKYWFDEPGENKMIF